MAQLREFSAEKHFHFLLAAQPGARMRNAPHAAALTPGSAGFALSGNELHHAQFRQARNTVVTSRKQSWRNLCGMRPPMVEAMQDRARILLSHSALGLRSWALARLNALVVRARDGYAAQSERLPADARVAAQRFGTQLWRRVTARFPGLADLLDEPGTRAPVPSSLAQGFQRTMLNASTAPSVHDVAALLSALRDPSAEVAAAAAISLAVCAEPSMEPQCHAALLEVLANRDGYFNPLTRVAALQSLVQRLGTPPSPQELEPLLAAVRDVDAEVSMAAIAAVAVHAPAHVAIDRLFPVAQDDTGFYLPMVRSAATRALERAGLLSVSVEPPAQS